jgi:hypothetical protein
MKKVTTALFLILLSPGLSAQNPDTGKQVQALDTVTYDRYGNLRVDDPVYNKRAPWYVPALNIVGQEAVLNLVDQYALKLDWARVGFRSWGRNLSAGAPWGHGWVWDSTRFANDMFLHPYTGAMYFDAARASGHSFWASALYTFGGSYLWKIFGENVPPERNSLIYTTIGGIYGGEMLYRLSSNVLDDRTTGLERFGREALAGVLSPTRFVTRLFDGKLSHVTEQEVYKKEPLNVTLYTGVHLVNSGTTPFTGHPSEMLNFQFDYGNPFEQIDRKPYDFFRVTAELDLGAGRKIVDKVTGYGLLVGTNSPAGSWNLLTGLFQNYDFYDNRTYELTTLGFGGGMVVQHPLLPHASWYSVLHLDVVPFGANNFRSGPDTTQVRDFNFGGGAEAKFESTLSYSDFVSLKLIANYYWLHTWVGEPGNSYIWIIRPRITIGLFQRVRLGIEETVYRSVRDSPYFPLLRQLTSEQKIFLMVYFEDSQRGGHYN